MGILSRLMPWRSPKDPYWEGFISRPVADPDNELIPAIKNAPEGRIFPVRSDLPEPGRLSRDLAEFATFLGASSMGIAKLERAHLESGSGGTPGGEDADELLAKYTLVVMCTVHAEHDPAVEKGIGGQHPVQESASINFNLSAYMRELGYASTVHPVDAVAVAVAAGLGTTGAGGKLVTKEHGAHVYVGDGVLTDLPLVPGVPRP